VSADRLPDVLRAVRLDGAFFYAVEASEPWSVEAVAAKDLTPRVLPGAEHLIGPQSPISNSLGFQVDLIEPLS
jgi:hypothetical protein